MSKSTIPDSLINEWFNLGKQIPKHEIATHSSKHAFDTDDDRSSVFSSRSNATDFMEYPIAYQKEEERIAIEGFGSVDNASTAGQSLRLDRAEEISSCMGNVPCMEELLNEEAAKVYRQCSYSAGVRTDQKLVIALYRDKIVNMIEVNRVTIIQGSTGSGKTTQVPQYILDHYASEGRHCNIVVTQPRRIAAMSVAKRVCSERNWVLGKLVGYQVGLDKQASDDTRLLYVTTGVLLQKLVTAKNMNVFTHIILDEVHERDQEMDFLLLIVRKLSRTVSKHTKVILMSATMDTDLLADYFTVPLGDIMVPAQVMFVEGKNFPIYEFWVDQLASLGPLPELDYDEPKLSPQAVNLALKLVLKFDDIEKKEQGREGEEFPGERGSVLCFLPGIQEINEMHKPLIAGDLATIRKWNVIPLHSSITLEEQKRVFNPPQGTYRKIILATNIAESSITVPDVKFVIDFCLTKNLVCDPQTNYTALQLEWASKSNCTQRKGRAGRVSKGRCYRMITMEFYNDLLEEYAIPEMRRCPLDKVVLQAKKLDMGEPKAILGLAIDPPDLSDIENTILKLLQVHALALKTNEKGAVCSQDADLTFVGRILADLPVDVRLGKLMVLGHAFGCLEECIIIAAGLSQKNIFSKPFSKPLLAYRNKLSWAGQTWSDCVAVCNVFKKYRHLVMSNFFRRPKMNKRGWGEMNFVETRRLDDVCKLVDELTTRLSRMNIRLPQHTKVLSEQEEKENVNILKLVIAGAFYPNYFTQTEVDEEFISKNIGGCPVDRTVMVTGLPPGHGVLYKQKIEKLFEENGLSRPKLEFDHSKVYVRFDQSSMCFHDISKQNPSKFEKVAPEVYCAIKLRLLRIPLELQLLPMDEANALLEKMMGSESTSNKLRSTRVSSLAFNQLKQVPLPNLQESSIQFYVTQVIDCGHFWAIYSNEDNLHQSRTVSNLIKRNLQDIMQLPEDELEVKETVKPDMLFLAPFLDEGSVEYYRARVESVSGGGDRVEVFFVDFGNIATLSKKDLRRIDGEKYELLLTIPMQAFECFLSCLEPSPSACPDGTWSHEARTYFRKSVLGKKHYGRVYSVVHNIVRLEIIRPKRNGIEESFNEVLKGYGLAVEAQESFLSKQNQALRQRAHHELILENDHVEGLSFKDIPTYEQLTSLSRGGRKIRLRGPESPAEKSFMGLTRASVYHSVHIEPDSVNSVLFHEKPQDRHKCLLVAAEVTMNPSGTAMTARSTTLMPDVPGLLDLVAVVFSPRVEFRTNSKRERYTGALCGLGYDEVARRPIFNEHDMELVFDAAITEDDIAQVNKIRMGLNILLGSEHEMCTGNTKYLTSVQSMLRNELKSLIFQDRDRVTPQSTPYRYKWGKINPHFLLNPELEGTSAHVLHVLPLLSAIELSLDEVAHVQWLHSKVSESTNLKRIHCRLCDEVVMCPRDLMVHLKTSAHQKLEALAFKVGNP